MLICEQQIITDANKKRYNQYGTTNCKVTRNKRQFWKKLKDTEIDGELYQVLFSEKERLNGNSPQINV